MWIQVWILSFLLFFSVRDNIISHFVIARLKWSISNVQRNFLTILCHSLSKLHYDTKKNTLIIKTRSPLWKWLILRRPFWARKRKCLYQQAGWSVSPRNTLTNLIISMRTLASPDGYRQWMTLIRLHKCIFLLLSDLTDVFNDLWISLFYRPWRRKKVRRGKTRTMRMKHQLINLWSLKAPILQLCDCIEKIWLRGKQLRKPIRMIEGQKQTSTKLLLLLKK